MQCSGVSVEELVPLSLFLACFVPPPNSRSCENYAVLRRSAGDAARGVARCGAGHTGAGRVVCAGDQPCAPLRLTPPPSSPARILIKSLICVLQAVVTAYVVCGVYSYHSVDVLM